MDRHVISRKNFRNIANTFVRTVNTFVFSMLLNECSRDIANVPMTCTANTRYIMNASRYFYT